ncbi:MAG: hypothetical protein U1E27_07210, partial [Kiritimatiellia bacterium]|nr:hypothetical protein [Kiritimatiellia bacterium]
MTKKNAFIVCVAALALTSVAQAQITNIQWNNASGGNFNTLANWTPGTIAMDNWGEVRFLNIAPSGDVVLSANATSSAFRVYGTSTTVTLDLAGHTYKTTNGINQWTIGNDTGSKTVTFKSSQPGGKLELEHLRIGPVAGDTINADFTGSNLVVNLNLPAGADHH